MKPMEKTLLTLAAGYLRHTPLRRGRWRIIAAALPVLRQQGGELGARRVRTRHGFSFHADLGDWLGQYVWLTGDYEPATAHLIARLLRPGDRFADIGANAGFFTLLAARVVGPSGRVFSFEPVPAMGRRLLADVAANGLSNVTLFEIAVSDREDNLTFHEGPAGHKGVSSLRDIANAAAHFQVKTLPLDTMAQTIGPLRLAKIDVEGAEHKVITGMGHIIARHRPYLLLEMTDAYLRAMGSDAVRLAGDLVARGYRMYAITDQGLDPMDPSQAAREAQYNALFAPEAVPVHWLAGSGSGWA